MNRLMHLKNLCQLIRYDILTSTTAAGSGHPTTSLSAVELMATLFFGGFLKYDLKNPHSFFNDRVIFSKGHGAPLLYALYHTAGAISYEELMTLRKFGSKLEGHPVPKFKYVDVASGSLGQGLSIGVGMAMGMKLRMQKQTIDDRRLKVVVENRGSKIEKNQSSTLHLQPSSSMLYSPSSIPKVWVLLGDSETAEGQVWEAIQLASYYKLNNLIGILDVNRLGQRGETMLGWDIKTYRKRIESFGWKIILVDDGHDLEKVRKAYETACSTNQLLTEAVDQRPVMIIAKTIKGKGISFLENKDGWHGKPVPKERLQEALDELGKVDFNARGQTERPNFQLPISNNQINSKSQLTNEQKMLQVISYKLHDSISTREAYGDALVKLGKANENIIVLDAETSNSTYAEKFKKTFPDRFIEMFIAEQNMVSVALGISKIGFIPFVSSFAAFLTRAFDQMRIAQYSQATGVTTGRAPDDAQRSEHRREGKLGQNLSPLNLKICGSHAGVSIGEDGPSQMALEDLAMTRSLLNSIVLYPSDAVSTAKLVYKMHQHDGMIFLRTTREKTPIIYSNDEKFEIGGSKIHRNTSEVVKVVKSQALIIAAGITLHEALKAQKQLLEEGIETIVLDCYSVKPIDVQSINRLVMEIKNVIVVEDHYPYGGLGEAVLTALSSFWGAKRLQNRFWTSQNDNFKFVHLCVRRIPMSGKPAELLHYEEIDADAIVKAVKL